MKTVAQETENEFVIYVVEKFKKLVSPAYAGLPLQVYLTLLRVQPSSGQDPKRPVVFLMVPEGRPFRLDVVNTGQNMGDGS